MIIAIFFFGIIFLVILLAISLYNRLVKLRNNMEQTFADIDVHLRQRHDLIPQLVESVKGYMGHERGVLSSIWAISALLLNSLLKYSSDKMNYLGLQL